MTTLLANGAVVVAGTLLLLAPGLLWYSFGQPARHAVPAGGAVALLVMTTLTHLTATAGFSTTTVARGGGVLLLLTLGWSVVRLVRRSLDGSRWRGTWTPLAVIALSFALSFVLLAPALLVLHWQGLTFGLVNLGNADQANYVLVAQNVVASGFENSHHVANGDLGLFAKNSYFGCTALIAFLSSVLPLSPLQAAMPAMGVALSLLCISLWSLGRSLWPRRPLPVLLATVVALAATLSTYTYGRYFLGGVLGLATVAMVASGVIELTRTRSRPAWVLLVAGGAFGVYTYGHMMLPVLLLAPFGAVVVALVLGRGWSGALSSFGRALVASAAAAAAALPALPTAVRLVREQSQVQAGWSLPAVDAAAALFWPRGLEGTQSLAFTVGGWLCLAGIGLTGLVLAARRRPSARRQVVLAGLIALACVVVALAFAWQYGAERYQTWKMVSFLLPIAVVAALPALSRVLLAAMAGLALMSGWVMWAPMMGDPSPGLMTSRELVAVANDPLLRNVTALNVRLPFIVETMNVGALLEDKSVVFTQESYYAPLTSLETCTLTTRSLLTEDERDFEVLAGDYVLLNRPSTCAEATP